MHTKSNVHKMRPQGSVIEPLPKVAGSPVVTPTTGYDGHYPVKFSDETDANFAARVAMFEGSLASAEQTEAGGKSLEFAIAALQAKYDADLLSLKESYKNTVRTLNGVPVSSVTSTPVPLESRIVKSADGTTRGVDTGYELKEGESFA